MSSGLKRITILAIFSIVGVTSCVHLGQRLLTIEIDVDGQHLFTGIRGVRDDTPIKEMWNVLPDVPFEAVADPQDSAEKQSDGTRTLEGKIAIRIKHVDRELTTASLSSLTLTRNAVDGSWSISKAESERIKQASAVSP